jgi:hypothetical protein
MKLSVIVAVAALAAPTAPVLAHCRTVHHKVHRAAYHAPVRHHAIRYASACRCQTRVAHRSAAVYRAAYRPEVYPPVYRRPRIVEVTYERPMPLYRPYRVGYAVPFYRPRPIFYRAGFEQPYFHRRWERFGGYGGAGYRSHLAYGGHRRGGWR